VEATDSKKKQLIEAPAPSTGSKNPFSIIRPMGASPGFLVKADGHGQSLSLSDHDNWAKLG
jgi:hypothetical protein